MTASIEAFRKQKKDEMAPAPTEHLHDARKRTLASMSFKASTLQPATQRLVDRAIAASRNVIQHNPGCAEIEAERAFSPIDAARLHSPPEQPRREHSSPLNECALASAAICHQPVWLRNVVSHACRHGVP
jgi:hypothetical protein